MEVSKLLTYEQVGGILGLRPGTVREYVKRGWIRPTRLSSRVIRIHQDDLEAFINSRRERGETRGRKKKKS
jgi:excisionase family DNA binding protein